VAPACSALKGLPHDGEFPICEMEYTTILGILDGCHCIIISGALVLLHYCCLWLCDDNFACQNFWGQYIMCSGNFFRRFCIGAYLSNVPQTASYLQFTQLRLNRCRRSLTQFLWPRHRHHSVMTPCMLASACLSPVS